MKRVRVDEACDFRFTKQNSRPLSILMESLFSSKLLLKIYGISLRIYALINKIRKHDLLLEIRDLK